MAGPGLAAAEWPRLVGATPVDSEAGSEVMVVLGQGAAVARIGVYGADGRSRLAPFISRGRQAVFAFGGGNHPGAVDCVGAHIVASSAERGSSGWKVERRFFQVRRSTFVLRRSQRTVVRDLRALSEFRGDDRRLPFDSCG
jgi:hypothetical protein